MYKVGIVYKDSEIQVMETVIDRPIIGVDEITFHVLMDADNKTVRTYNIMKDTVKRITYEKVGE